MKLMCIDKGSYYLTVNKIYYGEICKDFNGFEYYIFNDENILHGVEPGLFVDITEIRKQKLKELDI